jgi:hypothetical protein
MRSNCLRLFAIVITGLTVGTPAFGAIYTAAISPSGQSSPQGDYLTGSFDFGVEFREIHGVVLQFTMPAGFEGTSLSSAYSSMFSVFQMAVHGSGSMPADYFAPEVGLEDSIISVTAGEESQFLLFNNIIYSTAEGGQVPPPLWPTFLYGGEGQVSLFVLSDYWTKVPGGVSRLIFTAWTLPPDVENLRLVVHGTAVPEPGAFGMIALMVLAPLRRPTR